MEKTTKGLDLKELEGYSYALLLPDRIEMRRRKSVRKRRRSGNVECGDEARCNRITIR